VESSPRHPVVIVTWDRAQQFCGTVGGRLPTEAEWEFAARGGREGSIYPWGDQPPTVNPGAVNGAAFENERPHPVQSFAPNAYGLYDMAGNVWEWTADAIGLYSADAVTDPQGPASGRARIVRGGSFGDDPENLRVSNRTPNQPGSVNVNVGFRCGRDVKKVDRAFVRPAHSRPARLAFSLVPDGVLARLSRCRPRVGGTHVNGCGLDRRSFPRGCHGFDPGCCL
jgi:formylglycine-generating enzyme required for sulfatase activity